MIAVPSVAMSARGSNATSSAVAQVVETVQKTQDWAAKRKAQIEAAKLKKELLRLGDVTEEHTFRPNTARMSAKLSGMRPQSSSDFDMHAVPSTGGRGRTSTNSSMHAETSMLDVQSTSVLMPLSEDESGCVDLSCMPTPENDDDCRSEVAACDILNEPRRSSELQAVAVGASAPPAAWPGGATDRAHRAFGLPKAVDESPSGVWAAGEVFRDEVPATMCSASGQLGKLVGEAFADMQTQSTTGSASLPGSLVHVAPELFGAASLLGFAGIRLASGVGPSKYGAYGEPDAVAAALADVVPFSGRGFAWSAIAGDDSEEPSEPEGDDSEEPSEPSEPRLLCTGRGGVWPTPSSPRDALRLPHFAAADPDAEPEGPSSRAVEAIAMQLELDQLAKHILELDVRRSTKARQQLADLDAVWERCQSLGSQLSGAAVSDAKKAGWKNPAQKPQERRPGKAVASRRSPSPKVLQGAAFGVLLEVLQGLREQTAAKDSVPALRDWSDIEALERKLLQRSRTAAEGVAPKSRLEAPATAAKVVPPLKLSSVARGLPEVAPSSSGRLSPRAAWAAQPRAAEAREQVVVFMPSPRSGLPQAGAEPPSEHGPGGYLPSPRLVPVLR